MVAAKKSAGKFQLALSAAAERATVWDWTGQAAKVNTGMSQLQLCMASMFIPLLQMWMNVQLVPTSVISGVQTLEAHTPVHVALDLSWTVMATHATVSVHAYRV